MAKTKRGKNKLKNKPSTSINEVHVEGAEIKKDIYEQAIHKVMNQISIDQLYHIVDGIEDMCRVLRDSIRQLQRNLF